MRRKKIYEGKAKILYEGPERNTLVQYFKDDATAFNNKKKAVIEGKGVLNNRISEFILNQLNEIGIETHLIKRLNMREQLIKSCEIVPIEFVVRNIAAGTLANRLGMTEGTILRRPIIEYYYKNDDLNDPLVTEEHIEINNWASNMEIAHATETAFRINDFLIGLFRGVGIKLVDFKLEFGRIWKNEDCKIILADEISPDTCRLWDLKDEKKLDKDRFRRDLGGLVEAYTEVAKRLGIMPEGSNIMEIKSGVSKTIKLKKR
jgi:phosphoribosylaminoimidazole-succinocarboxamide synthase